MSGHCKRCVLTLLEPLFGDDAGSVALEWTCFPMDCDVARLQAYPIIHRRAALGCTAAGEHERITKQWGYKACRTCTALDAERGG